MSAKASLSDPSFLFVHQQQVYCIADSAQCRTMLGSESCVSCRSVFLFVDLQEWECRAVQCKTILRHLQSSDISTGSAAEAIHWHVV